MKLAMICALGVLVGIAGCASADGDEDSTTEDALTGGAMPKSIRVGDIGNRGRLSYNQVVSGSLATLKKVTTYELEATPGDEVEIRVTNKGSSQNDPAILVLGDADPAAIAKCEQYARYSPASADSCRNQLTLPVLASNDNANPSTKDAALRAKLTNGRIKIGVIGAQKFDVVIDSVVSAVDSTACVKSTTAPPLADHGPYWQITRTRECPQRGPCGPWRELSRRAGDGLAVAYTGGATVLKLVDNDGSYSTFDGRSGVRTTEDCLATTYCSLSAGTVHCNEIKKATVVRALGRTALDSDSCRISVDSTVPSLTGVLGSKCVSLSDGVKRTRTATGTTETETVVVQSW